MNNLRYGLTRESIGLNGDSSQPWVQIRDLNQDIAYSSGDTAPVHNMIRLIGIRVHTASSLAQTFCCHA